MPLTSPFLTELLQRLTLEQKVRLLTGASTWSLHDEPAIGLRAIVVSDGPTGVRGSSFDDRDPSASLPSATSVAASWDRDLVRRLGRLIASEARSKGVDVVLGPTVNLHRSPRGGRHFEAFSEDPFLTGEMGAAYVASVQAHGVATTPKHYVANDSETERMTVDVRAAERTLRELYLAPFERMVDEGTWLVMSAYNSVDGVTMTENELLREPLKTEWGFDGVVISDWTAVRDTVPSANSGQDLAMPGPDGAWGQALVDAVKDGRVSEAAVDDKVLRLLLLASRVGALEDGPAEVAVEPWVDADVVALLREAAADGMVLARNDGTLPCAPRAGLTIAAIGQHAVRPRNQGGGSATVFPSHVVSPLDGLRAAYGDDAVRFAAGLPPQDELRPFPRTALFEERSGDGGVHVRFLDADGAEFATEDFPSGRLTWINDSNVGTAATVEISARFVAARDGEHELGFAGLGLFRFDLDGATVFSGPVLPEAEDFVAALLNPPHRVFTLELREGQSVELLLSYTPQFDVGMSFAHILLGEKDLFGDPQEELERAVELAATSDVAVVVVGTTEALESEGFDRPSLALPAGQDELVRRVSAVNKRTVVVVNSGAPVAMPWIDEVAAVILAWFPGQEFGSALADVLSGEREPGGRMPTSWAARDEDVPVWNVEPVDGQLAYAEGVNVGYRAWLRQQRQGGAAPALPFGSGLGYTSWELGALEVVGAGEAVVAEIDVTNTGARAGKHIVQAYLSGPGGSAIDRPIAWLAGFAVVRADAGETVTARIPIPVRAFQHWDADRRQWASEGGTFTLRLASSVVDPGRSTGVEMNAS
ncbi:beta-glucosidase [Microterricola gilva]|uniref:Beta-glucosidase n=1 Tax=Microterricola gilva TaxID=393267 RepID=A0A4Q8AQY6_9MICO|nr:glycoside hydrolase family 3 C-terminal domain-containing protein [Microterricola gilva]RZU67048.1 beta-glucosidase [Microterricola gilva]